MADIEGDENDNTIGGTTGSDNISGKGGGDTINSGGGTDSVSGGGGNDDIDGGSGNDTIYGGAGDDTITGGAGDDVIIGGRGDDVMSAGSGSPTDTFVIRDGDGNDTITDFDPGEPDVVRFDMGEMNTYQDVLDRISSDGSDSVITYDNGSTLRLLNTSAGNLSSTNFEFGSGPVCLSEGTMIETPAGPRRVETLKAGDLVQTLEAGPQKITQVVCETVLFRDRHDRRKPILVQKGALGDMKPNRDLIVSPQHRFFIKRGDTARGVLVAAVKLTKRPGIRRMNGRKSAKYLNLLMDRHQIVFANNCPVETLLVTPYNILRLAALNTRIEPGSAVMASCHPIALKDPLFDTQPEATDGPDLVS